MSMLNKQNNIKFTIPLFSYWYAIISLIFILMRVTNIIDWSPLWLLSPLWIPTVFAFSATLIIYILQLIIEIIQIIISFNSSFRNY